MNVTLQFFQGCPNWQVVDQRLRDLADEIGFQITYQEVTSSEQAEALSFHGSPTIQVDGQDPFANDDEPVGLACRMYQTPGGPVGAPTLGQIRVALTRH